MKRSRTPFRADGFISLRGFLSSRLALACLLASAGLPVWAGGPYAPALLPTAAVEVRQVFLTYPAEAVVEAIHQATVSAQVQGRVVDMQILALMFEDQKVAQYP